VEVIGVDEKAPASKAGVRKRDIIIGVNEFDVKSMTDMQRFLTEKWQPGQRVTLTIIRGKEKPLVQLTPEVA
jgi:S1-C subfamily serine protease